MAIILRAVDDVRPFEVECDWCGRKLSGQMRRSQVGQIVVVGERHLDRGGRNCPGTGRAQGTWPLKIEIRTLGRGYELLIGGGQPRACTGPAVAVAALIALGVDRDVALRQVVTVAPGEPVVVEVCERRKVPRAITL